MAGDTLLIHYCKVSPTTLGELARLWPEYGQIMPLVQTDIYVFMDRRKKKNAEMVTVSIHSLTAIWFSES